MDVRRSLIDLGRSALKLTDQRTAQTLQFAKSVVSKSLLWSADGIDALVDRQLIARVIVALRSSSEALRRADAATTKQMAKAISSSAQAFRFALAGLDRTDDYTRSRIMDNVHLASIIGQSFAGIKLSEIEPSFRAHGRDITPSEMAKAFAESGCRRAVFCVPGLMSDETLWSDPEGPQALDRTLEAEGLFLIRMRFNPGTHISDNGQALASMMRAFMARPEVRHLRPDVLTFSLGGLLFRSALYYSRRNGESLAARLGRAVIISSPDGGSYLEKLGFLVGRLENSPVPFLQVLGLVGNQRSHGIRDLSHGIIREEDWIDGSRARYGATRYFGELDDVDAYQVYSLLYPPDEPWREWLGDGIVERASLALLSDVYRRKGPEDQRVHVMAGLSHYQVLHAEGTCAVVRNLLEDARSRSNGSALPIALPHPG